MLFVCHLAVSHSFALVWGSHGNRPDTDTSGHVSVTIQNLTRVQGDTRRQMMTSLDLSLVKHVVTHAELRPQRRHSSASEKSKFNPRFF